MPLLKRGDTSSANVAGKMMSTNDAAASNLKTFSVQAMVNKTQVPAPISIPTTVKLRAIPAASSGGHKTTTAMLDHPLIIHHQQHQQPHHHQSVDSHKKRRVSSESSQPAVQHQQQQQQQQLVNEANYVLPDTFQVQTEDGTDTHDDDDEELDDGEEEEEEEESKCDRNVLNLIFKFVNNHNSSAMVFTHVFCF